MRERTLGAEHTDVANSWIELAKLHRAAGEKSAAGAALERAAAIIERNRERGLSMDYLQAELDAAAKDL